MARVPSFGQGRKDLLKAFNTGALHFIPIVAGGVFWLSRQLQDCRKRSVLSLTFDAEP